MSSTCYIFFFKQKTAYEMRISDWSSDVCSSDLGGPGRPLQHQVKLVGFQREALQPHRVGAAEPLEQFAHPGFEVAFAQIGRASCRARVCQYVSISVVAVSLKKKTSDES